MTVDHSVLTLRRPANEPKVWGHRGAGERDRDRERRRQRETEGDKGDRKREPEGQSITPPVQRPRHGLASIAGVAVAYQGIVADSRFDPSQVQRFNVGDGVLTPQDAWSKWFIAERERHNCTTAASRGPRYRPAGGLECSPLLPSTGR